MIFQSTECSHEHPQLSNSHLTCPAPPHTHLDLAMVCRLLFAPKSWSCLKRTQSSMLMGPLHTQEAFSVLSKFYLILMEPQISSSHYLSQMLATVPEIPVLLLALLFSIDNCSSVSGKKQKLSCENPPTSVTHTLMSPPTSSLRSSCPFSLSFHSALHFVPSHFIPASAIFPCLGLPPLCLQKYASLLQPSKWLTFLLCQATRCFLPSFHLQTSLQALHNSSHSLQPAAPWPPTHDFSNPSLASEFPGQWSLLIPYSVTAVGTADSSLSQHY